MKEEFQVVLSIIYIVHEGVEDNENKGSTKKHQMEK